MNRRLRDALPDHAAESDARGLPIDQVGIRGLRLPVRVMDRERGEQPTVATVSVAVGLPADQKGTHMSRMVEVLEGTDGELTLRTLPELLGRLQRRLETDAVHLEATFPYFLRKRAPVSGAASWLDVEVTFQASRVGPETRFTLGVAAPVTSLCPCSKAISAYGAHNQRSIVEVRVTSSTMVWVEDVVAAVEGAASAPVYALLKREDEKHVTEQAYDHPRFVEDLVREVTLAVRALPGVTAVTVEADNQESIHHHSAWARLAWEAGDVAPSPTALAADADPGPTDFGTWLRARRTALRLSQESLAASIGVSGSFVCRVERGEKQLSTEALEKLARVLGVDPPPLRLRAGDLPAELMARIAADPQGFLGWAGG